MGKISIICCFILKLSKLQGDDLNFIKTKSVIGAFASKLLFFKHNLTSGEFYNFPNLCESRFTKTSSDSSKISFLWRSQIGSKTLSLGLRMQKYNCRKLLELQANEELKSKFKLGYRTFWLQRDISRFYPSLWSVRRCRLINEEDKQIVNRGDSG
uniref:Uncharacterized protein n=1 Tax=Trichuris muris TaxID=70415 RepID=A0A5S6Q6F5_TRIMR